MYELDVPPKYQGLYEKAKTGRSSKAAVRSHCLYCMGWDSPAVRECTAPWCPLFQYRLGSGANDREAKEAELNHVTQHKSLQEVRSIGDP